MSDPRFRVAHPSLPPLARYVEALEEVWDSGMLSNHGVWAQRLEERELFPLIERAMPTDALAIIAAALEQAEAVLADH